MSIVIEMQKDHMELWQLAGEAFPGKQLKEKFAAFLVNHPQQLGQDKEVYAVPTEGMPESVIDALYYVRGEGHAMYSPAVISKDGRDTFEVHRPIYEKLIELLMQLLRALVGGFGKSRLTPELATQSGRPGRGRPLLSYDGDGFEL